MLQYDIREASQEIRDSYKMYYKLKTSFLEETLNDVLCDEDGFDILEMSQASDLGVSLLDQDQELSMNGGPQLPLDIAALVEPQAGGGGGAFSNLQELPRPQAITNLANRDENHVIRQFEAVEELPINRKAWGSNVSLKPPQPLEASLSAPLPEQGKQLKAAASLKPSLSAKLFQSTRGFAKRNPRKPLSHSSLNASSTSSSLNLLKGKDMAEELPDFETILLRKAQEYKEKELSVAATPLQAKEAIKTQVDDGWLQRNTKENTLEVETTATAEPNNNGGPPKKTNFGLANLDLSKLKPSVKEEAQVKVEQVNIPHSSQVLHPVTTPITSQNPVAVQKPPAAIQKPSPVEQESDSDSDSVVAESEEEPEPQEYRQLAKRRRIIPTTTAEAGTTEVAAPTEPETEPLEEPENPDFSADEEADDATYEPAKVKKEKAKRKQAAGKRHAAKTKAEAKPKAEKKPKVKAEKKPKVKAEKKPRNSKKTAAAPQPEEDEEEQSQPLNPEDLKYVLALEAGDITSVPRINAQELEKADATAQRYISTFAAVPLAGSAGGGTGTQVDEKRAAARRKMEERIASGKLNENFVTINIQKKKFVRGKKTVNFSKYKKQQWRHKKRVAALSGPDMDMGGCDGGVLTCFQCGGVGHFAQQCKVKGDSLLPLSAQLEEDPSPFPTLAEAQEMASQGAVVAHSRNIARLPQAANAAILQPGEEEESDDPVEESSGDEEEESQQPQPDPDWSSDDPDIDFEALDAAMEASLSQKDAQEKPASPIKTYVGHKIPEEFLKQAGLDTSSSTTNSSRHGGVKPLYDLLPDGTVQETTPEVLEALHMFGHSNFRKGQDRAIMRTLSGLSSLVTLSTGSGKSLCYQLPAYLYSRKLGAITLVISPLVSLMEDQVTGVPHFLRAHCLHTNQTPPQRMKIQQMIANGEIDILLVSPEAVVSGERATGFGAILRQLPPIAFACIDEAHCVSQWSHNFRPSYLMICKVLRKNLGVHTVLGLTATATLPTRVSIINHLGIADGERGVISDTPLPDNLVLSVSKDENRDSALLQLLNSER